MTQKRTVSFEQPLTSLEENHRILGIETPGLLCGWDGFTYSGTTINLHHNSTGILKTDLVPVTQQGPFGIICSRQGTQILEDAVVPVVVATNGANAFDRIDLLIMQHQHVEAAGGSPAVYSIIQGSNGGPVSPAIPNDKIQVLVGKLYIKASATDHSETDWIREPIRIGNVKPYTMDELDQTRPANNYETRDFNNCINAGIFTLDTTTNRPNVGTPYWHLTVGTKDLFITQLAVAMDNGKSYSRSSVDGGAIWQPWQNLNNVDVLGFDPDDILLAIGAPNLASLDYSSNFYVTDATSLETAIGDLDAALKVRQDNIDTNATNISNNLAAIGNRSYTGGGYHTNNGESITASIDAIDQATGGMKWKNFFIFDWNMNTTAIYIKAHGLDHTRIKTVTVMLIKDTTAGSTPYYMVPSAEVGSTPDEANFYIDDTNIVIVRKEGGLYDSNTDYDGANTRGYVVIGYTN